MAIILNIETATRNCSVSIAKDGIISSSREIAEQGYSHAEKLHVFIAELLVESQLNFTDLNAIAVSQGPGSYTGLRIGVSAAKGLCYALDLPLIAIDTLALLAMQVQISSGCIIPMIDARRMEVYSAVFNASHQKIRDIKAEIITEESFVDISQNMYIIGDCQAKCAPVLHGPNITYLNDIEFPSSRQMAMPSYQKFIANDFVDLAYFEPFYLKDFLILTKKGS